MDFLEDDLCDAPYAAARAAWWLLVHNERKRSLV
jgi:hypothetical protein